MPWAKTGVALGTLPPGTMREVNLDGTSVLLVRLGPEVHAVAGICTHEGGILVDGSLAGARIKCPVHGAVFDARSGTVLADPDDVDPPEGVARPLQRFPTRILDGLIEVDLAG